MPTPCAISGNLQTLLATTANGALVVFRLINQGWSIPYVSSTTSIVNPEVTMVANSSGNISGNLWGNDVIMPSGTQYQVEIGTQKNIYNITGSTWNLNTAVPVG